MAKTVHHHQQDHVGVLRRLEHLGMSRGRRGSKAWLYVGTGLWTVRTVRRLADRREEVLIHEKLKPGERIIIANAIPTLDDPPPPKPAKGRRARKAQRKAEARAAKEQAKRDAKAARKANSRRGRKAERKAERKAQRAAAKRGEG